MPRLFKLLFVILFLPTLPVAAQPGEDQIDDWFISAESAFKKGRDRKGLGFIARILGAAPKDKEALALAIGPAMNTGSYENAQTWSARLLELDPNREHRLVRARVLVELGRLADAQAVLDPLLGKQAIEGDALAVDFEATALAARIHLERGRRKEADALYDILVQEAKRVIVKRPRDLVALADAYRFFRGPREAEKALAEAQKTAAKDEEQPDPLPSLALGRLYLESLYLPGDAVEEFKEALRLRPRLAEAQWGLAEAYAAWQKSAESEEARKATLAINPAHPGGLAARAAKALGDLDTKAAGASLDKLLSVNPTDRRGLTLRALLRLFEGDREAYDEELAAVFALDPGYAEAHHVIADVLNDRRRWMEALDHMREAVKIADKSPALWDKLARYALFLGLEEEGREALRTADRIDRFSHPWRKNMFEVFRVLDAYYKEFRAGNFIHRVHRKEVEAFKPYLLGFCQDSYGLLTKKYDFVPDGLAADSGKILVEWFRDHGGFSVRTLGFTHLGATGVCFGPFICMDSPGSRKAGEFSWARTFHHELAHTMTVGLSKGRTPRWLTEGLSTYEEKCFDPSWDRGMYRELFNAIATDDLCKVLDFDTHFAGPRIVFAYFQGGLQCEWMVEKWGIKKIRDMLVAYGEDRTSREVIESVLGISPDAFDAGFKAWIQARMKDVRLLPRWKEGDVANFEEKVRDGSADEEVLLNLASAYLDRKLLLDTQEILLRIQKIGSDDPRVDFLVGRLALAGKKWAKAKEAFGRALAKGFDNHDMRRALAVIAQRDSDVGEAREHLLAAIETFPMLGGAEDPRLDLARLAETPEATVKWKEAHLALTYEDLKTRGELVRFYKKTGDEKSLRRHLVAMIRIYPLDAEVHVGLGELELEKGDGDAAVTEFTVALALLDLVPAKDKNPATEADTRVRLGRAFLLGEEGLEEARSQAEQALALVPGHVGAEKLLKEIRARSRGSGDRR